MGKRARLNRLEVMHDRKAKSLAEARAEKTLVDARVKRLEDAVGDYRAAIARERRRRLRAAEKQASSSDADEPEQLALEDQQEEQGDEQEGAAEEALIPPGLWVPDEISWKDLEKEGKKLKNNSRPSGMTCMGVKKSGPCTSVTVHRVGVPLLRKWPVAWDRENVKADPWPVLSNACDTRLRRN